MRHVLIVGVLAAFALDAEEFQSEFKVDKVNLGTKGTNPYFPLTPGYKLEYGHGKVELSPNLRHESRLTKFHTGEVESCLKREGSLRGSSR